MLGKLIKHEFRATAAPMLILFLGVLVISGLTRLCMLAAEFAEFFAILAGLSVMLYSLVIWAAYVFIYVLIIRRFYKHIYGAEGYLTLTLPVRRSTLILAKLIPAMIWQLLGTIVTTSSLLIIASYPEVYAVIGEAFYILLEGVLYLFEFMNTPGWVMILELVLFAFISAVGGIMTLYASVSIGQLFKKHRFLGSVLGYFIIYVVTQIIMSAYVMVMSTVSIFGSWDIYAGRLNGLAAFQIQIMILLYIAITALIGLGCWIVTHGVMKKSVNLQ
ncbi:MAG: hypothetical protein E7632_03070 [Ruminococcaceae bacterium]|nr:hypothetical protein [Oscillospiraceae bacterium]